MQDSLRYKFDFKFLHSQDATAILGIELHARMNKHSRSFFNSFLVALQNGTASITLCDNTLILCNPDCRHNPPLKLPIQSLEDRTLVLPFLAEFMAGMEHHRNNGGDASENPQTDTIHIEVPHTVKGPPERYDFTLSIIWIANQTS